MRKVVGGFSSYGLFLSTIVTSILLGGCQVIPRDLQVALLGSNLVDKLDAMQFEQDCVDGKKPIMHCTRVCDQGNAKVCLRIAEETRSREYLQYASQRAVNYGRTDEFWDEYNRVEALISGDEEKAAEAKRIAEEREAQLKRENAERQAREERELQEQETWHEREMFAEACREDSSRCMGACEAGVFDSCIRAIDNDHLEATGMARGLASRANDDVRDAMLLQLKRAMERYQERTAERARLAEQQELERQRQAEEDARIAREQELKRRKQAEEQARIERLRAKIQAYQGTFFHVFTPGMPLSLFKDVMEVKLGCTNSNHYWSSCLRFPNATAYFFTNGRTVDRMEIKITGSPQDIESKLMAEFQTPKLVTSRKDEAGKLPKGFLVERYEWSVGGGKYYILEEKIIKKGLVWSKDNSASFTFGLTRKPSESQEDAGAESAGDSEHVRKVLEMFK